jgi:hypothetical protein
MRRLDDKLVVEARGATVELTGLGRIRFRASAAMSGPVVLTGVPEHPRGLQHCCPCQLGHQWWDGCEISWPGTAILVNSCGPLQLAANSVNGQELLLKPGRCDHGRSHRNADALR